jgi:transposase InsO family protein
MCKLFKISRSGYYAWQKRVDYIPKREQVRTVIKQLFLKNKGLYGSPRLWIELTKQQIHVSQSTVARVMKSEGLVARPRVRYIHTTDSDHDFKVAENTLDRDFSAERPNQKWVSDISYIRTRKGWAYLTIIMDLFDRLVVGWHISQDMSAEHTTIAALKVALARRKINLSLLFHSDRGSQYCADIFTRILEDNRFITQSMSRKGNCWDNAVAESFFKSLKTEWIHKKDFQDVEHARRSVFDYIERWYNTNRIHSGIGYMTPLQKYYSFFNRIPA